MNTAILTIEGMHCDGCAETVKALVSLVPGVRAAEVSFKEGRARVLYDPQTVTEARLVKVIETGGFRVPDGQSRDLP